MKAILFTGGIGDVIAIESLLTPEERKSIEFIFYATRAYKPCVTLFNALPKPPHQAILWKDFSKIFSFHNKKQVIDKLCAYQPEILQKIIRKLTVAIEDYSISRIFEEKRNYQYSSFINNTLISIEKFNLPENYYCICPYSINDKRDNRRDYNQNDWNITIDILNKKKVKGIVLNTGNDPVPKAPCLINLTNKTNILEAVEITKQAKGYLGIDSCLSVIAVKVVKEISIKSHNDHCYKYAHVYYAPHKVFGFLNKAIRANAFSY